MGVLDTTVDLEQTLRERFGLERFRPGQREVIGHVLQGRDVLCVMPTGGGKSLCYQLPALLLEGTALVVSPLIALMKDQVDALTQRGIRATLINSTLDPAEQRARLVEVEQGRYDLVYVAPERFRSARFVEAMARVRPALLAVDEAHCISEWGHDFRPDYARLGLARRRLGSPPCIALTATATDLVRRDIADQLDLRDPAQFVTGFDRPNLVYQVIDARRDPEKLNALGLVLDQNPGSAIVYTSSRARCELVGQHLERALGKSAVIYHAGLAREERNAAQDRFMSGEAEVVVATNAFGMGVDKPDIRAVVHFNLPGTLEAYYQEAGRAGRDGLPAACVLLYSPGDRLLQELFIENEYPPPDAVYRVYEYLRRQDADPIELTQAEIREAAGIDLPEQAIGTALKLLEGVGAVERFRPWENKAIVRINVEPDEPSLVERLSPQAHVQRIVLTALEGLVNRRFAEPVYFQPDELAAALGLDRQALNRALKHLTAELPVDYIPPFRGNALRVVDRQRRARDLGIDFSALNERKGQEYAKLERMVKYAESRGCRRYYILNYFGDAEAAECGRCDNCATAGDPARASPACVIDTPAGREVIVKALSGVARAKGRFGKTVVAQMLTGSNSEKMVRWGLTRLSTFGILGAFKQAEVAQLLDALAERGLVESQDVDRFRPVINLTAEGWDVLRSQVHDAVTLSLPAELAAKVRYGGLSRVAPPASAARGSAGSAPRIEVSPPAGAISVPGAADARTNGEPAPEHLADWEWQPSDPLRERLKALRTQWAREASQPPYCIFTNETLEALVRERPATPHELARIKGLGPARLERFGTALLEAVVACPRPEGPDVADEPGPEAEPDEEPRIGSLPIAPPTSPAGPHPDASRPGAHVPTEEWTWRLLDRGFRADEAAAIRGLEPAAIIRHATWMARKGHPVPLTAFLDPETITRWEAWHHRRGEAPPPDQPDASPGLWPLFLACRTQDGSGTTS